MAVSNPEIPTPSGMMPGPTNEQDWESEGISLREYLLIFLSWWREIALITLLSAIVVVSLVLLLRAILPPTYESVATVAIIRSRSDINFDERFRTLSEDDLTLLTMNSSARRAALVGLVADGAIAQTVIDRMGDVLNRQERQPALLLRQVQATLASGSSVRGESDLIRISVRSTSAQKAARIANIWAEEYVRQVNALYGAVPQGQLGLVLEELVQTEAEYNEAQSELEAFIASNEIDRLSRLVNEKQEIINQLQLGRNTAITTFIDEEIGARSQVIAAYLGAKAQNSLLAFEEEQRAKRALVQALIQADTDSRLLALTKEREVRNQLFTQYVDAEIANRLAAFETEQAAKGELFSAFARADTDSKAAVINQQVQSRIDELSTAYDSRARLVSLEADARALQTQIEQAGASGETSNSLAILLLKSEVFASSSRLPSTFLLNLDETIQLGANAENQLQDIQTLTQILEARILETDGRIFELSQALLNNEGLFLLDNVRPEEDNLFSAIKRRYFELFELGDLASAANAVVDSTELAQAIQLRYNELFDVGSLVESATTLTDSSPLFATIREEFPELFEIGELATLSDQGTDGSGLGLITDERAQELLQLSGLEALPGYTAASAPLAESMDQLEKEIQSLKAQRESEEARLEQLTRQRDLISGTLNTLQNKEEELSLATTVATNSEVQLALPAVQPAGPEVRISLTVALVLGVVVGGIIAVGYAYIAHLLGIEPFLSRRREVAA